MLNNTIPVFYACDDHFVKYAIVSIYSLIQNASKDRRYHLHILHTGISEEMQQQVMNLRQDHVEISFDDVTEYLQTISSRLPIRDYYSKTTYFRLFIAEMFPEYDKAIYVDADTIVQGDISQLYDVDIQDAYLGACHEQAMIQANVFGTYVEKVIGISRYNFFNAGLLLINCEQFRVSFVLDKFTDYLHYYDFVVTQDEDYLNLICKDHVYWLDQRWNTEIFGEIPYPIQEARILHYIMTNKPWHYEDCRFGSIFWDYAKNTSVYESIRQELEGYTDEQRERDQISGENLKALAQSEIDRDDNFLNRMNRDRRAKDRVAILHKIEEYEKAGRFDEDVEDDPATRVLQPDEIEYVEKSVFQKMKTKFAFHIARKFVNKLLEDKKMIIKEIRGIENFQNLDSGAVITCNHFNAFDSFAIQLAYDAANQPDRQFYRVIREGNYTTFPGFYGFLMRHCNTLPLSSNLATMKKFLTAVNTLLKEGNFILIYPEQSMWWNYRKPKPLKKGAYTFAAKNNVPVLPCFITMKDSGLMGEDGFFIQEYTIHVGKPLYPDNNLPYMERVKDLMDRNYNLWKDIYEEEYQIPLTYTTECG